MWKYNLVMASAASQVFWWSEGEKGPQMGSWPWGGSLLCDNSLGKTYPITVCDVTRQQKTRVWFCDHHFCFLSLWGEGLLSPAVCGPAWVFRRYSVDLDGMTAWLHSWMNEHARLCTKSLLQYRPQTILYSERQNVESKETGIRQAWVESSCVTLGKFLPLSEFHLL